MTVIPQSPYRRAIGARESELHPVLRTYFSAIPAGHVGIGEGVFVRAGTPRRWLWPFLRPLDKRGVVFAGWEQDVPFRVVNRTVAFRAIAEREFQRPGGTWVMQDAVALGRYGRIVDELGEPGTIAASFDVDVRGGALLLTSVRVGVRWRGMRMRLPRLLSPIVRLVERFDDERGQQHVSLTVDAPLIGRVYEYEGWFDYRIEKEKS